MRWILKSALLLVIYLTSCRSEETAEVCQKKIDLANGAITEDFVQCKENPCDPNSKDVTKLDECAKTSHCFILDGNCSSKIDIAARRNLIKEGNFDDLSSLLMSEAEEENLQNITERFFQTGGGGGMSGPNFMPSCQPYPMGCNIHISNPISILEALEPPVNIPYCLRIPCDQMLPSLELDRNGCVRRPGCYYDSELANMRQLVGQQVLAGVPVCHLAVRNRDFQEKISKEKMTDGSSFNGLYTKCYLKRNPLKPNPGCPIISTLEYFGYSAKRAGWEGITDEECLYIDGCPTSKGCMLPAATSSIRVRSATVDMDQQLLPKERFGQPMCQPFTLDSSNAESFVNDYNQCLSSGCVVDDSVSSNEVFKALYSLIQQSDATLPQKWNVIRQVSTGEVGPYNIKETLEKLKSNSNCDLMALLQGGGQQGGGQMTGMLPNFQLLQMMLGMGNNVNKGLDLSSLSSLLTSMPNLNGGAPNFGNPFAGLGNPYANLGGPTGVTNPLGAFSLEMDDEVDENSEAKPRFFTSNPSQTGDGPNFVGQPSQSFGDLGGSNPFGGVPNFGNLGGPSAGFPGPSNPGTPDLGNSMFPGLGITGPGPNIPGTPNLGNPGFPGPSITGPGPSITGPGPINPGFPGPGKPETPDLGNSIFPGLGITGPGPNIPETPNFGNTGFPGPSITGPGPINPGFPGLSITGPGPSNPGTPDSGNSIFPGLGITGPGPNIPETPNFGNTGFPGPSITGPGPSITGPGPSITGPGPINPGFPGLSITGPGPINPGFPGPGKPETPNLGNTMFPGLGITGPGPNIPGPSGLGNNGLPDFSLLTGSGPAGTANGGDDFMSLLGIGTMGGGQTGMNPFGNLLSGLPLGNSLMGMGADRCPFSDLSLGGLPKLKGKFTGCCERNRCYYPRTTILRQYSGIASYYTPWGAWSQCSVTCGGGRQSRARKCIKPTGVKECDQMDGMSSTEEKVCNDNPCPVLTNWGSWSQCSVTCGLGKQDRTRECRSIGGAQCDGALREVQECAAPLSCPLFSEWSAWTDCNSDCGPGQKGRERKCIRNCDLVSNNDLREEQACYTVNGNPVWLPKSGCGAFPTHCYSTWEQKCLKPDQRTEGCCTQGFKPKTEKRKCSIGMCVYCDMWQFRDHCDKGVVKRSTLKTS